MDKCSVGKRIKETRLKSGFTQQALAQKACVSNVYLGEIERGVKMPSLNSFIKIVQALDVSADYILRGELNPGKTYAYDELIERLQTLTPAQRKTAEDILDGYLRNL